MKKWWMMVDIMWKYIFPLPASEQILDFCKKIITDDYSSDNQHFCQGKRIRPTFVSPLSSVVKENDLSVVRRKCH